MIQIGIRQTSLRRTTRRLVFDILIAWIMGLHSGTAISAIPSDKAHRLGLATLSG